MALQDGAISEGFKSMTQAGGEGGNDLTKGLWTPKEDAILVKYVMENGARKWSNLSRKFGLMRRGNSCRLRWFNHLRSNLKKGDFTPEEEDTILKLHAKYGNRWSQIAGHLPGRTDNEIKNYWNIRWRRHVRARLPIYPPEILQEIRQRHFNHQKLDQPPPNQTQLSSTSSVSPQNPNFSPFPSSSSSSFDENPSFSCIPSSHQTNTTSISSSNSIRENPADFTSINSMSLSEAMNYPLLVATLFPPVNMFQFNHHNDNNGGVILSPPTSQHFNFSNSPYTPLFTGSQLAPSDMGIVQIDDAFLSENFEIEIPSIQSCFKAITPISSSNNGNDHFIMTSNGEDNYNMAPELCSGRNSGLLGDVLRQSATLMSSQLPYKQSENDQSEGRIMHDDVVAIINHPNSTNANLEQVFGSTADDINHMDDLSSLFLSNDFGVISEADVHDNLNMMIDDLVDFRPSGPPQESNLKSDGASTEPAANIGYETKDATTPIETDHGWDTNMFSPMSTIPSDIGKDYVHEVMGSEIAVTPIEQERDWALGYMPSFS